MRYLRLALFLLLWAEPARARFDLDPDERGSTGAQFLKLGADARGVAMGQAMTAAADDSTALYWNPAGLAALKERHLSGTHSALYESVFYDFLAYAHPIRPPLGPERRELRPVGLGALAVGLLYLNAGELEERDNQGTATGGAFTPQDWAILAGWGGSLTRWLDLGITFKYIDARIQEVARTAALDAGGRLRLYLGEWPYTLAFSAQNMGPGLKYRERTSPLPLTLRAGQSLRVFRHLLLSSDFVFPRDDDFYPAVGAELRVPLGYDAAVAVRSGWNARLSSADLDGSSRLTLGAGLYFAALGADYAWVPFGSLGGTHRLSLSYRFPR